jgi:hypothetical protein
MNLEKIPETYLCYIEDRIEIGEIINKFFENTIEYIESKIETTH